MARRSTQGIRLVLLLVFAVLAWFFGQPKDAAQRERERDREPADTSSSSSSTAATRTGAYETYTGCRYEEHRQNDGDSFRVRMPDGRVEQFRLYYVDCPESDFRTYPGGADNYARIHEQALVFGISDQQAVEIGKRGKALTHKILTAGSFTLYTRWEDPFGDQRYHAFIQPAGGPFLDETLVREGLARIHTKPAVMPDGTPSKERQARLRALEQEAKKAKRGAWGVR
jgi:endonuclease YncB( thermonuclease family)